MIMLGHTGKACVSKHNAPLSGVSSLNAGRNPFAVRVGLLGFLTFPTAEGPEPGTWNALYAAKAKRECNGNGQHSENTLPQRAQSCLSLNGLRLITWLYSALVGCGRVPSAVIFQP